MKTKFLIIGFGLLAFGLINLFWYVPISLGIALNSRPFPFQHLKNVTFSENGGTGIQIGYDPIHEAIVSPYWLVWSLALYAGIAIIVFVAWRKRK